MPFCFFLLCLMETILKPDLFSLFLFLRTIPQLDPSFYDLDISSETEIPLEGILNIGKSHDSVTNIVQHLENIYCDKIGVEFFYLEVSAQFFILILFPRIY